MRIPLIVILGKAIQLIFNKSNLSGGSALPGLIAEKIDGEALGKLSKRLDKVILITGTNGKTTTTKMLVEILKAGGHSVITNGSGSNLTRGLISALIRESNLLGRLRAKTAVLEVDEASMPEAVRLTNPSVILVTNLFRDQLDRYGELDKTAVILQKAIKNSRAKVILNADDPLVSILTTGYEDNSVIFYGVTEPKLHHEDDQLTASDSRNCLVCGHVLNFEIKYFGHIGKFSCPNCEFRRPELDYEATTVALEGLKGSTFSVSGIDSLKIGLPGLYNVYNSLAALAVAAELGVDSDTVTKSLKTFTAAFGRIEQVKIKSRNLFLLLIKNPTGFNQVIQTFLTEKTKHNVLIAINDNFADGQDVSWLWDVEFESLVANSKDITVTGKRSGDMALRLKYAGCEESRITEIENLEQAATHAINTTPEKETLMIMPTYTAMLSLRKILQSKTDIQGFWVE